MQWFIYAYKLMLYPVVFSKTEPRQRRDNSVLPLVCYVKIKVSPLASNPLVLNVFRAVAHLKEPQVFAAHFNVVITMSLR